MEPQNEVKMTQNEIEMTEYLRQLEGCIITKVQMVKEGGQLWPRIEIGRFDAGTARQLIEAAADRRTLVIGGDEEGNAPGYVLGLPEN